VNNRSDQNTDLSLLERLGDSRYRSHAWSEFIDRYTFLIFDWLRRWDVDPHSMEDVLQETLMRILGNIKSFERRQQGSFRAWLKTIAHSSWLQLAEDTARQLAQREADPQRASNWLRIQSKMAEESLLIIFDEWATEEVLNLASSRVRRRVDPETWDSFQRVVIKNESVKSLIDEMGCSGPTIYKRLFRVRRLLSEEIADIEGNDDTGAVE
jgi:RNA polymerase sigma-70 factor (ECF subfamily)